MHHRESIRRGFNRLSPFYDGLAFLFFGKSLWRAQSHFIPSLPRVKAVLIVGGGTGKILSHLISNNIADHYYYLDISDAMVKRAEERVKKKFPGKMSDITFHAGTVHDLPAVIKFDIIITPYVLDMIADEELLHDMRKMDFVLKEGGSWLFCDFDHSRTKGLRRVFSKALISSLYFAFRIAGTTKNSELPGIDDAFKKLGYKIEREEFFLGRMLVSRVYSKI